MVEVEQKCPACQRVEGKPIMMYLPDGLVYEIQEHPGKRKKGDNSDAEEGWQADTRFYSRYPTIHGAVADIKNQIPKKDWPRYRIAEIHTIRRVCAIFHKEGWMLI